MWRKKRRWGWRKSIFLRSEGDEFGVWEEALVIVGNMEVVVPKSFVERRGRDDVKGDLLEDDDGLWSD